ncbi:gluconate 2-dehydrogenase subunit 3 family protein [Larkinella terrae]|uniref:Gluconate 2-dehydrogenase subunit 3 family protein n=1 Tax=Larkinella terrae TaxID=2025311 RepID=A0A7K0ES46_9BACT|nr:gluconate 2-dehydrogenase subunit 3 family protein [Larkinella terrae]MRS64366.1 gluconate 2-dehydrogenase subunit 3 family protein [Larkinella terrae]
MKRRNALKSLLVTAGSLAALPSWAAGWTPETVGNASYGSVAEQEMLAELVETFIPETTTPGAKSLKVHQFILRMVNDCYDQSAQDLLKSGLAKTDELAQQAYTKPFLACDTLQRTDLLRQMGASAEPATQQFANLVKDLTIRGYTNSEYYLVNVQKYVMAPGFYHGCVNVVTN